MLCFYHSLLLLSSKIAAVYPFHQLWIQPIPLTITINYLNSDAIGSLMYKDKTNKTHFISKEVYYGPFCGHNICIKQLITVFKKMNYTLSPHVRLILVS